MVFLTSFLMKYMPPWLRRRPKRDNYMRKQSLFMLTQYYLHRPRNCWRLARDKWLKYQQDDMKQRSIKAKRYQELFSQRIVAALSEHQMSYNDFMRAVSNCNIELSKKSLSQLAIYEPRTFKSIVDLVKTQWCEEGHTEKARTVKPPSGVVLRGMLQEFKTENK